jgi:hypothetical protein
MVLIDYIGIFSGIYSSITPFFRKIKKLQNKPFEIDPFWGSIKIRQVTLNPFIYIWYASTRHISSPEDRITSINIAHRE